MKDEGGIRTAIPPSFPKKGTRMLTLRTTWITVASLALLPSHAVAAPPAGLKGAGNDADKWLMDNADFVLTVNVKQLAGSTIMTRGGAEAVKAVIEAEPKVAA